MLEASNMPSRMEAASSSSHHSSTLRRAKKESPVDPKWGQKYTSPMRLGELPDFNVLHKDWDSRLTQAHNAAKRKSTIPEVGLLEMSSSINICRKGCKHWHRDFLISIP